VSEVGRWRVEAMTGTGTMGEVATAVGMVGIVGGMVSVNKGVGQDERVWVEIAWRRRS
jgi:hypothetical protein